jgi:hypothetical protein
MQAMHEISTPQDMSDLSALTGAKQVQRNEFVQGSAPGGRARIETQSQFVLILESYSTRIKHSIASL